MGEGSHQEADLLRDLIRQEPETEIEIDLAEGTVTAGGYHISFSMPEANRKVLLSGDWVTTSVLISGKVEIEQTLERLPYLKSFSA